jgi:hypothetical protein
VGDPAAAAAAAAEEQQMAAVPDEGGEPAAAAAAAVVDDMRHRLIVTYELMEVEWIAAQDLGCMKLAAQEAARVHRDKPKASPRATTASPPTPICSG